MHETLRSHILHLLQKDGTPRKPIHLEQELGISGEFRKALCEALDSLCAEGRVIVGPGNAVSLPSMVGEITGVFRGNARGHGFITPEQGGIGEEVFIPAKSTGGAMTGDRVTAEIVSKDSRQGNRRLTGKVVEVLSRAHSTVFGTLRQEGNAWWLQPDGEDFSRQIEVENVDDRKAHHGDKVAVRIRLYPTRSQPARGKIAEVLGRPGRFEAEILAVTRRHGLFDAFDSTSLVEASNAKTAFDPRRADDREDITDALVITIDPPDAKDFDDAVSLNRDKHGRYVLGVHVADVSHFVPEGSALDRAARARGNSVYLPGRTLPMLPEMLSNGVCSLQPGERRYTKSVYLTYSKDGQVQASRFANTVMQSCARLTYEQAAAALQRKTEGVSQEVVALLSEMEALARCIERRRRGAGMLQLQTFASELVFDESGHVIGVRDADTSYPQTIIEMFMVEANVAVASLLDRYCIPFMRRIHPEPNAATFRGLSQILRLLGVTLPRQPQRAELQKSLDSVHDSRMSLPVNILILRSLEKAIYSPAASGHYALAAGKYCHFTSPIRRYADLMVHRALQAHLAGDAARARCQYTFPELSDIGRHLSETEQAAEDAEQELKAILTLGLLQKLVGCEVEGVIVSLSAFGASVHLPEYRVEGMVSVESLGPDQWQFNEENRFLFGRHTGATVRLGQALRVRIVNVHPAARQLDLAPAMKLTTGGAAKPPRRKHSRRRSRRGPAGPSGRRR